MDEKWIDFFKALGVTTAGQIIIFIVLGFFGKKLIEYFFSETIELKKLELNKDLEGHKKDLTNESDKHRLVLDKELESYKGVLNKLSFEHQTKFERLHSEKATVIKESFKLMVQSEKAMESLMRPMQLIGEASLEDKMNEAAIAGNRFLDYYHENELMFDDETCTMITEINSKFLDAWKDFKLAEDFKYTRDTNLYVELGNKRLNAYYDILKRDIPNLKGKLKLQFRKELGAE